MTNLFKSLLIFVIVCLASSAPGASIYSPQAPSPQIEGISATTLDRSGRVRIFGANFGARQDGSRVLIDGVTAPVSTWSDSLIVAYVPEAVPRATSSVQVVTKTASSNKLQIDAKIEMGLAPVTAVQANGSIKWQFEVDGDHMEFRPTIGSDGTIYFQDDNGHLYALKPDGSVKWIFQGGYPSGPVAVGADNTVYVATDSTIQAVSSAGTLLWQFTDQGSQVVIGGPAVGPDGKIYAAMDLLGLGAIALSPVDGHLVWSNPGNPRLSEYGQSGLELVFGPAFPGGPPDQFYFACDNYTTSSSGHLFSFSVSGNQRWVTPIGGGSLMPPQMAVAPDGLIINGVGAYDPSNGSVRWSAYTALGSGSDFPADIGPDGTVYVAAQYYQSSLAALNGQNGAVLWRIANVGARVGPVVSPRNDVVVVGAADNYGLPGSFKAFTIGGQSLWQINLPGEPYPGMFEYPLARGRFSQDGGTVYMGTTISGEPPDNVHCYLYAIQTAESSSCSFSVSPLSGSFIANGGQGSIGVTAPNGCGWTATSNVGWIGITSAQSNSGNGVLNYVVSQNVASTPRSGSISIAGQIFTVTQEGAADCQFWISPKSKSFGNGGGSGTVTVATSDRCGWSASSGASWITITSAATSRGNGTVSYTVAANNTNSARVGTMLVGGQTFTVKQKPR